MTKTVIRGAWPSLPQKQAAILQEIKQAQQLPPYKPTQKPSTPNNGTMKVIKEIYVAPTNAGLGQGKYTPFIEQMLSGKPGTIAVECSDKNTAKLLTHAASRHLKYIGKYETLRPRTRRDADDCVKVWIVNVNA